MASSRRTPSRRTSRSSKPSRVSPPTTPARDAQVLDTSVVDELRTSFLSYALSVIVARALPDARDGLKPVHRRILFSLHQQNIKPSSPYKKSSRVVGDTMGKYHPHGDSAIYEALVRLAQDFSMRLPLVDPHGNFGSLDDSAAASRYTECRLAESGLSLLDGLDEDTVDFQDNYDGTEREPSVLPCAFPNLLVNGSTGVAVGMATNIPPHNLAEVAAAARHLLANPNATVDDLCEFVQAPDFPTGGEIVDLSQMREMYRTGKGAIQVRARAEIVDLPNRRKGIEVTELPYLVGPEKVIARVRELIGDKRLTGISDARDFSDRRTGLRLVFEIKSGFDPEAVLAELYRLTPMEESFAASFVALINHRPRVCSLKDLLAAYVDHRLEVVRRRSEYRLDRARRRAHLVEGLLVALNAIDEVVALIRSSKDTDTARTKLMHRFQFSQEQATHILEMPLRRLTSLETGKLKDEMRELKKTISALSKLLASKKLLAAQVSTEIEHVATQFSSSRRTALAPTRTLRTPDPTATLEIADTPCVVGLTVEGALVRLAAEPPARTARQDRFHYLVPATTRGELLAVARSGTLRRIDVLEIPEQVRGTKGVLAHEVLDLPRADEIVGLIPPTSGLLLVTDLGVVKRLMPDPGKSGVSLITLADGDSVVAAVPCADSDMVSIVTSDGQFLRFSAEKVRPQGRTAAGMLGIRLGAEARVVAAAALSPDSDAYLSLATDSGAYKRTPVAEYPTKGRATSGVRCVRFLSTESSVLTAAFGSDVVPLNSRLDPAGALPPPARRDGSATRLDHPVAALASPRP